MAGMVAAVVLLFAVRVVAPALPRVVGQPAVEETRQFTWPATERFVLVNHDGAVRVWSHAAHETAITAVVRIHAREGGQDELASAYAESLFAVTADEHEVKVVTEPGERPDLLEMRVDYDVFVSHGDRCRVISANGMCIGFRCGRRRCPGTETDIFVRKPGGMVTAQTTNGRINVVDAPEGAQLKTVNGNIYAHMLGGKVNADTTNGTIVAHVLDEQVDGAELNSMNGGITLVMAERCSAMVDARTMHGGIRSDFAIDTSSGVQRRHHLRGDLGSGHALVNMQTLNGNIWLARGR